MNESMFYIQQGFSHVLDMAALDHVLFFIASTVVYRVIDWKKALWLITFFTIGHTLTFALSSYEIVNINAELVEFLIPITILTPLLLNIYIEIINKDVLPKHLYTKQSKEHNTNIYFAFFFGLIHGLGFSNYFKMLLDEADDKLIPLLKFALGIEFAQIIIVALVLFLGHIVQYYINIKKKIWVISISLFILLWIIPMLVNRFPF